VFAALWWDVPVSNGVMRAVIPDAVTLALRDCGAGRLRVVGISPGVVHIRIRAWAQPRGQRRVRRLIDDLEALGYRNWGFQYMFRRRWPVWNGRLIIVDDRLPDDRTHAFLYGSGTRILPLHADYLPIPGMRAWWLRRLHALTGYFAAQ
jgi:hypothetical protein